MQDTKNHKLLRALLILFRPIARMFLHHGLGHEELVELAKAALVQVATEDYGLRGRPTNASRVAAMTGLSRREVRRLKDRIASGEPFVVDTQAAVFDLLDCWRSHRDFQDDTGNPLDLPMNGERSSFRSLARRISRDLPPGALLAELKRIGAVVELDDGVLRLQPPPTPDDDERDRLVADLEEIASPMLTAIAKSMKSGRDESRRPVRSLILNDIPEDDLHRFRAIANRSFEKVIRDLEHLFTAYRSLYEGDDKVARAHTVTVGHFYEEEPVRR